MDRSRSVDENAGGAGIYPDGVARAMRDIPERMRPREVLERVGVAAAPDDVLLAVILRGGVRGMNVHEIARRLLEEHESLAGIARADPAELEAARGIGRVKAQVLAAALELGRRMHEESLPDRPTVRTPADAVSVLAGEAALLDAEVFWALVLDNKNRLKRSPVTVSRGLIDASLVHAREVFRHAIGYSAASVVVAHNHPSGDPTPSAEDIRVTRQLVEAGRVVGIRVLDHVVLGGRGRDGRHAFTSLRELGAVSFE
ncbi:MAG: JAB domain-containing protein [Lentisphaerae bacterium]|nr:JAB domain-containing protein [Lentisphaerota bacterium]